MKKVIISHLLEFYFEFRYNARTITCITHVYTNNYTAILLHSFTFVILVPDPSVQITISDNETVGNDTLNGLTIGDSLTLNCTVNVFRGISGSVNIMWYTGGSVVRRVDNLAVAYTNNDSVIYTDLYEISSLTVIDNGRDYECTVMINGSRPSISSDQIVLNFNGELLQNIIYTIHGCMVMCVTCTNVYIVNIRTYIATWFLTFMYKCSLKVLIIMKKNLKLESSNVECD